MKRKKRSVILPVCLASILSVLVLFPVYVLVLCALKEPTSIFELSLLPKSSQIRLENFSEVFERIEFGRYMLNSFIVAFSVTIVALLFHSMAGFAFSHMRFRGKNAIFVGIMITEEGETDIHTFGVLSRSKYDMFGTIELGSDPDSWLNQATARYFGVEKIAADRFE